MKILQQNRMKRQPCEKAAADKFKRKMAHLTLLIEQIKRYNLPLLNRMLEMKLLEDLLSMPELAGHDWTQESARVQAMVLDFLNVYISAYSKALKQLKVKNLQIHSTMNNQKYCLHIGHELINDVTLPDLNTLHDFLNDFLRREADLPLASGVPAPASSAAGKPLVFKNIYFDADTRRFDADFNIYAEGGSLPELSGEGLIDLYHTLRAFLARSEKVLKEASPEAEIPAERPRRRIIITPQQPGAPTFPKDTTSLCKRISLYGQDEALRSDYVLSTPFGSFYRMSRGDLEALSGEIGTFLNQSAG